MFKYGFLEKNNFRKYANAVEVFAVFYLLF